MTWRNLLHALVPRPFLIIGLFALGVAAGVSLPLMLAPPPYGQQTIDQQIGSENSALCASFGFTPGTSPEGACEASLTEMRHRHEATLRY